MRSLDFFAVRVAMFSSKIKPRQLYNYSRSILKS